jgi:hypothetical protein
MPRLEDPPKSPLKRGTLNPQFVPPFLRGARGDLICSIIKGNWYYLRLGLAALTCPLLLTNTALANELLPTETVIEQETVTPEQPTPAWEELSQDTQENSAMEQVTSVSQLSDVRPDDWAFQALQLLIERYGCISGYPNGTYRGDRTELEIDEVEYRLPLGKNTRVYLGVAGIGLGDLMPTVSPLFSGSSEGSISTFGRENPIRRQGDGAGIGIFHNFGEAVTLSFGYIASDPDDPEEGVFDGPYGASTQLIWRPSEALDLSLTYVRSYNSFSTGTGSELANDPFDDEADEVIANSFGAEASLRITSALTLGGRVGWIQAKAKDLSNAPEADIFTWSVLLAFPDLGNEGSVGGIVIGQPPKVIKNDFGAEFEDRDTSLHLEAFYRFQLTDDIAITPGLFVITNPEHNDNNDTIYIGTIRTTLTF